ncbi:carotenoid oxygenase family protein [Brevundimonas abyssalis]|uniref:carotenoid oxygenase family protein n=1 Tax=Brevundimonas abyssalis TaxID=1125965 RepID=UPI0003F949A5|nr:carotenoid oxygenase family protein [Brevundimonas abyssalis]
MSVHQLPPIKSSLKPSNHPYLTGAWTPILTEVDATDLTVLEGRIPDDIDGVYVRNTENQIHQPLGRYHPSTGTAWSTPSAFAAARRTIATASCALAASRPNRRRKGRCGAG